MPNKATTIRKGWKTTTLGKAKKKIGSGATPRGGADTYKTEGIALIRSQNVRDFKFEYSGLAFIDEKQANELANVEVEMGDILLNITGDSVARVCAAPEKVVPARVNQHVCIIRTNEEVLNRKYVYYFLLNPIFKNHLLSMASTGATRNALTKRMIENLEIFAPIDIAEQRAIAAVLSSLDDKIELLRDQNKTLEATAQAILKEWLVNFNFPDTDSKPYKTSGGKMIDSEFGKIPEGWRVGKIRDIVIENARGIAPSYSESGIPVINQRCVRGGTIIEEAIQYHDNTAKKAPNWAYLQPNDILINSMGVGTLGRVSQVFLKREKEYLIHSCITILRANLEIIDPVILGYKIKSIESQIEAMGSGTTGQTSLNNSLLGELKLIIPSKNIQDKLSPILKSISLKIDSNYIEIETLSALRDVLLPKLMKGELRVRDFND